MIYIYIYIHTYTLSRSLAYNQVRVPLSRPERLHVPSGYMTRVL